MTHWFLPQVLDDSTLQAALQGHELLLAAEGLPDLSRAQEPDQIKEWLKQLHPEATPEHIAAQTQHFWRLGHELLPEDTIIVRTREGNACLIGEVTGIYRREGRSLGMCHIWPVEWRGIDITTQSLPALDIYAGYDLLVEITDEDALKSLTPHVPSLRKGNATIFRWVAIGTLIFELIYFWPRG